MASLSATLHLRLALSFVALGCMGGCLWLPNWPLQDKVEPAPVENNFPFAHCTPRPNRWEPVLLGAATGPRKIECRIQGSESILWTLTTEVDEDDPVLDLTPQHLEELAPTMSSPLVLGRNVEGIELHRESLPWSPRPYAAVLRASVQLPGEVTTKRWPVLVVPAADELDQLAVFPGGTPREEDDE